MSWCRSISRSRCATVYPANAPVHLPIPSACLNAADYSSDSLRNGPHQHNAKRLLHSAAKLKLPAPSTPSSHHALGPANATLDPRPHPSPGTGIRDRLRFWKYDADLKKQPLLNQAQSEPNVENDTAIDPQTAEGMLEDFDPEELDAYIAQLDAAGRRDGDDPEFAEASIYRTGDIMELAGSSTMSSRLAVFVRCVGQVFQYYTIEGTIKLSSYQNALFVAKGFVKPTDLDPLISYFPTDRSMDIFETTSRYADAIPRNVGEPIVKKLVDFQGQFEEAYRKYASIFDNAHDLVAHPTETTIQSLEEITSRLTGIPEPELTAPLLLACSNCLLRSRVGFRIEARMYSATRRLEVESKESAAMVDRVHQWVVAYQEEKSLVAGGKDVPVHILEKSKFLKDFAAKVRPLIDRSREFRHLTPDGNVLTVKDQSQTDSPLHGLDTAFNASDRDIIRFVKLFLASKTFFYHMELKSAGPVILRAVERYEDRFLGPEALHTLLVEIGVLQPFEDFNPLDRFLLRQSGEVEAQLTDIQSKLQQGGDLLTAAGLEDSMEHMRHDFGDLPVFCIDAPSAKDIDDGISFEDIPDSPGQSWLHAHIVGLPAFAGPNHVLSKYAEQRHTSQYLPDMVRRMFPDWVGDYFSLSPNKPTLTISLRLDQSGEVVETTLRAGRVHNVIRLSFDAVDATFGYSAVKDIFTSLSVGPHPVSARPQQAAPPPIDPEHAGILRRILDMNVLIKQRRLANAPFGMLHGTAAHSHMSVHRENQDFMGLTIEHTAPQAVFAVEDPSISIGSSRTIEQDLLGVGREHRPSDTIVEETMLLANRHAAEWAASRNITLPFIASVPRFGGLELENELLRQEMEAMARGIIPFNRLTVLWFRLITLSVQVHPNPAPHRALGFPVYTKLSSPLRRFVDIVCHWNLYAAMREEARLGRPLTAADNPDSFLPVPHALMQKHTRNWSGRTTEINRYAFARRKHWLVQATARAFYLGEHPLPSPMIALMRNAGGDRRVAIIQGLELPAVTYNLVGEDGNIVRVGDYWEVRIARILLGTRSIELTPVRRIRGGKELERMKRAALKMREAAQKEEALGFGPAQ